MKRFFSLFSLLASSSTLVCCALPALFVSLGMGTTVAGLVSAFPGIVLLSQHKILVFSMALVLLSASGILLLVSRNEPCPIDPKLAKMCSVERKRSKIIYIVSVSIFLIGSFVAFILPILS